MQYQPRYRSFVASASYRLHRTSSLLGHSIAAMLMRKMKTRHHDTRTKTGFESVSRSSTSTLGIKCGRGPSRALYLNGDPVISESKHLLSQPIVLLLLPFLLQKRLDFCRAADERVTIPPDRVGCICFGANLWISTTLMSAFPVYQHPGRNNYLLFQAACAALTFLCAVSAVKGGMISAMPRSCLCN